MCIADGQSTKAGNGLTGKCDRSSQFAQACTVTVRTMFRITVLGRLVLWNHLPQSTARLASPFRTVETQCPRLHRRCTPLAIGTRQPARIERIIPSPLGRLNTDHQPSRPDPQGQFHGILQPGPQSLTDHDPIDHDVNRVVSTGIEFGWRSQFDQLSVHPCPDEPIPGQLFKCLDLAATTARDDRGQQHHPPFLTQSQQHVDDRLWTALFQRLTTAGTVHRAGPCKQQPQMTVDLRGRRQRAASGRRSGALVNADGCRQPLNQVHLAPFPPIQSAPLARRQSLQEPPLPFGEDDVQRQSALAAAADSGDRDQPIARNIDVQSLQVVHGGPTDPDHPVSDAGSVRHCGRTVPGS